MSDEPLSPVVAWDAWYRPMRARDPRQAHRGATRLELLFDLCFVVAVALAADRLHHALAAGHPGAALRGYAPVFFAIWWAWMNFTWFASAYDTDDVPYRLATLVQIAGVLVLAAGVPRAFDHGDLAVGVVGFITMRVVMVAQWLRVAHANPARRATARRYVLGITLIQVGWTLQLFLPDRASAAAWLFLVPVELAVPVWAERPTPSPWHPEHVIERFGLFTLIVLGESVLAATTALQVALDAGVAAGRLLALAGSGLLIVFAMWWLYFDQPAEAVRPTPRRVFLWGYGHLPIFAAAAAVGAGLQVAVDHASGAAHLTATAAGMALAVPVAMYLLGTWVFHLHPGQTSRVRAAASPLAAALVLATVLTPWPLPLIALVLSGRVVAAILTTPGGRDVVAARQGNRPHDLSSLPPDRARDELAGGIAATRDPAHVPASDRLA